MNIPNGSGPWWEKVSLDDISHCTATVKEFFENENAETANVNQLSTALPLFILCGGDCSSLVQHIQNVSNRVYEEAMRTKALTGVEAWSGQLERIYEYLQRVSDSYDKDVTKVRESVEDGIKNRKYARLKIHQPKKHILKRR